MTKILALALLLVASAHAGEYKVCSTERCFSRQAEDIRARVLAGETVLVSDSDPATPFDINYVFKRVSGADPELIAGLFATSEELPKQIDAITDSTVLRKSGNTVLLRYELDVRRLAGKVDLGALGSKAPVSKYAVTNHFEKSSD